MGRACAQRLVLSHLAGQVPEEGREVLGDYTGIVVVDGFAVYEVLARDGPGLTLAHCWAHTKRKYDESATTWPTACAEIGELIGELCAIERLVPGSFPGDATAKALRQQLRTERSQPVLDRMWKWATEQVGLPRSDFGKAVRYMLERWTGLTRFVTNPRIPLDNNAAERALRGPVVGRKNHYGSRSMRGTQVAALFYTLCETAKLVGVDPRRAYLLHALYAAIGNAERYHLRRRSPHAAAGVGTSLDPSVNRRPVRRQRGAARICGWLHSEGHLQDRLRIKLLLNPPKPYTTLSDRDIRCLATYRPRGWAQLRTWTLAILLLDTGLRIAEALTLEREGVHLDAMVVRVLGKGQRVRLVPISGEGRKVLFRWLSRSEGRYVLTPRDLTHSVVANRQRMALPSDTARRDLTLFDSIRSGT